MTPSERLKINGKFELSIYPNGHLIFRASTLFKIRAIIVTTIVWFIIIGGISLHTNSLLATVQIIMLGLLPGILTIRIISMFLDKLVIDDSTLSVSEYNFPFSITNKNFSIRDFDKIEFDKVVNVKKGYNDLVMKFYHKGLPENLLVFRKIGCNQAQEYLALGQKIAQHLKIPFTLTGETGNKM